MNFQEQEYNQSEQENSSYNRTNSNPLQTIKQILVEDSLPYINNRNHNTKLSLKMKGLLLIGMLSKRFNADKSKIQQYFYKWYANRNLSKHIYAIDKFLTSGNISKFTFFNRLKIIIRQDQLQQDEVNNEHNKHGTYQNIKSDKTKQDNQRFSKIKSFNQQRQILGDGHKRLKSVNLTEGNDKQGKKLRQQMARQQIKQEAKKVRIAKALITLEKNHVSFKNILIESQPTETIRKTKTNFKQISYNQKDQSQQNLSISMINGRRHILQNQQGSLSYIGPVSGQLRIDLITCTKIFDTSVVQHSLSPNKVPKNLVIFLKVLQKIQIRMLNQGFRKLMEYLVEDNYEQQLIRARRHLELVGQNFMIDCQIDTIMQNHMEQTLYCDNVDRNIQILKQKLMYSRTVYLLRVLKKLFYSKLTRFFKGQAKEKSKSNLHLSFSNNIYQVNQLVPASSTSLENSVSSQTILRYIQQNDKRFENQAIMFGNNYEYTFKSEEQQQES